MTCLCGHPNRPSHHYGGSCRECPCLQYERGLADGVPKAYRYAWGNNPRREELKGRECDVIATGSMGSALVEFENGERVVTSKRALRKRPEVPTGSMPTGDAR